MKLEDMVPLVRFSMKDHVPNPQLAKNLKRWRAEREALDVGGPCPGLARWAKTFDAATIMPILEATAKKVRDITIKELYGIEER